MNTFWAEIFGNPQPVEVEIGAGTGAFILAAARRSPQVNFFGVERSYRRIAQIRSAIDTSGVHNLRVIATDGACLVETLIPANSVRAYHVYFPDPWWKRRHHRRRLFTPEFTAALGRTLQPGGHLYVATDVDETFELILRRVGTDGQLAIDVSAPPTRTVTTVFERKGLARGGLIREAAFLKPPAQTAHTSSAAPITPAESPS